MNFGKLLKSASKLVLAEAKKNPKATGIIVGTVIGGSIGAKIKKTANKLPY